MNNSDVETLLAYVDEAMKIASEPFDATKLPFYQRHDKEDFDWERKWDELHMLHFQRIKAAVERLGMTLAWYNDPDGTYQDDVAAYTLALTAVRSLARLNAAKLPAGE